MLQLVANYGGVQEHLEINVADVPDVTFTGQDGVEHVGANTAARFIAGMSPAAEQLLGRTPEQQAQASLWACCVSAAHACVRPSPRLRRPQLTPPRAGCPP
jgi:hypothetical protein